MSWIIKCWISIEEEEPKTYLTKEDLEMDLESLRLMQPENKYIVIGNKIKCYIPAEPENPEKYLSKEMAQKDIDEHFVLMQPENIYEAVEIEDDKEEKHKQRKRL